MDWFFGRRAAAERVPGDRVLPLRFFEDSRLLQECNLAVSFVFDEVLDPEKLRRSLEDLVRQDGWQRLGGRLKRNAAGEIEWHIPTEFTAERPAITFSHTDHGVPAASHPIACRISQPATQPAVLGNPDDLSDLSWGPGCRPGGIEDYLTGDRPVLGLRVHSFTDRTMVVLLWQHLAFDTIGMQYVVEAWTAMLSGRLDEIPTPCNDIDEDPLHVLGTRPGTEPHVLAGRRVGLYGLVRWGLGFGVDMVLREKENRMICVPETYWRPQMEKALDELRAEAIAKGTDVSKVFLTESDVLAAWIMRCVVRTQAMAQERTVVMSIAMSFRKAFEGDIFPAADANCPYVGNAWGWANVIVTAGDAIAKPLSWLARQIRHAINEQGTRAQHEAYFALVRASGTGLPIVVFGDGGMAQVGVSNWARAGLFGLDFAPARKNPADGSGPCRPSYVQENHGPVRPTNAFLVLGKDNQGSYWASAYMLKGQWSEFQRQLERDFT